MDNSFGPLADLLPDEAYHVEQACRRFEAAWKAGPPPRLEDYLCPTADPAYRAMLHEFVLLDVHYRQEAGQSPRPEDYAGRFPGEALPWPGRSAALDPGTTPRPKMKVAGAEGGEQPLTTDQDNTLLAGRYQVLAKLGQGGMGVVYKAHDRKLDRLVAVKVLPARRAHDDSAVARFEREARALARLSHPHIVQAHDSGEDGGRPFLVMEYVEGVNLHQVLREYGALPPTIAADFIYQAALGLEHAHAKNLIHRDLKPGNLLVAGVPAPVAGLLGGAAAAGQRVTPRAGGWKPGPAVVKILDLGLARFVQDQLDEAPLTQEGTGLGTPDYMAPEQFSDALRADVRTDIYGLGCTLYHLIAGQVPFPGSSFSEKAQAHARKEAVPLEEHCPEMPGGLALVVARMMAKHPAERFLSASAVADALAPFVAGGSPSMVRLRQSSQSPGGQRTQRRPRRVRQALAWAAGLAGGVVVLGLIIVAWPRLFPSAPAAVRPTQPEEMMPVTIPNGLTVASNGRGQFRTIGDALAKVKPGMTIQVLDDATYSEALSIDDPERHAGIVLEAVGHATLESVPQRFTTLAIEKVPRVTVRGFHFKSSVDKNDPLEAAAVVVTGNCPGVRLENLVIQGQIRDGICLQKVWSPDPDRPIVIENCQIQVTRHAIAVIGQAEANSTTRSGRIAIRVNQLLGGTRGVEIQDGVADVHVTGNTVRRIAQAGLQLEDPPATLAGILIANNTVRSCDGAGFRVWDHLPHKKPSAGQVTLANNLFIEDQAGDALYVLGKDRQSENRGVEEMRPGDMKDLIKKWSFSHNWRDRAGSMRAFLLPLAPEDHQVQDAELPPSQTLQPRKDSPLATGGAGGDLPSYVGAVPPEGVPPWDWDRTWKARVRKAKE